MSVKRSAFAISVVNLGGDRGALLAVDAKKEALPEVRFGDRNPLRRLRNAESSSPASVFALEA